MRQAAIDIDIEAVPDCLRHIMDAGLKIVGSMTRGVGADFGSCGMIRIVVEDEAGTILPEQCAGWRCLVNVLFAVESHGMQRVIRLDRVDVVGRLMPDERASVVVPA